MQVAAIIFLSIEIARKACAPTKVTYQCTGKIRQVTSRHKTALPLPPYSYCCGRNAPVSLQSCLGQLVVNRSLRQSEKPDKLHRSGHISQPYSSPPRLASSTSSHKHPNAPRNPKLIDCAPPGLPLDRSQVSNLAEHFASSPWACPPVDHSGRSTPSDSHPMQPNPGDASCPAI